MEPIIEVKNISKCYQIADNKASYLSLRDALANLFRFGKGNRKKDFWALRDVSFTVEPGECIGIIGRNGAGKSTLLKVLSKITPPSSGKIICRGKVASLLEVGTGFHPELSGRENVMLNGSILGMKNRDIQKKFDEIVAFSGVQEFIDTPLKHYSSGMQLRLAFAVAAFLEPEIMVIDEVLAVGDAEFQKKCLVKMNEVSKNGRTILFVSHNLGAVSALCNRCVYIDKGSLVSLGPTNDIIRQYIEQQSVGSGQQDISATMPRSGKQTFARLLQIKTLNDNAQVSDKIRIGSPLKIVLDYELMQDMSTLEIGFSVSNNVGVTMFGCVSAWDGLVADQKKGRHQLECIIPSVHLLPGVFHITPWIKVQKQMVDDEVEIALQFETIGHDITGHNPYFEGYTHLNAYQPAKWQLLE